MRTKEEIKEAIKEVLDHIELVAIGKEQVKGDTVEYIKGRVDIIITLKWVLNEQEQ